MRSKSSRLFRRLLLVVACAYPLVLALLVLALLVLAEGWWVTTALLYTPKIVLGAPLPFLALALLWTRQRRWLWTQLVAALLLLFPLMGLALPWPTSSAGGRSFRLLSLNADSGHFGPAAIAAEVASHEPDIVLIQEGQINGGELSEELRKRFPHVEASTQFTLASRFPILSTIDPERLPYFGRQRSPRFMKYVIETSIGAVTIFNVHPVSPRGALRVSRFRDALHQLRTGAFLEGDPDADLQENAGLRGLQIATVAELAAKEHGLVLIAGDTNLPGLSAILRNHLSQYEDAFRAAGSGFGYTFPAKHPFLRLDRIFAGRYLRFTSFHVTCPGISDHLCVVADIELAR